MHCKRWFLVVMLSTICLRLATAGEKQKAKAKASGGPAIAVTGPKVVAQIATINGTASGFPADVVVVLFVHPDGDCVYTQNDSRYPDGVPVEKGRWSFDGAHFGNENSRTGAKFTVYAVAVSKDKVAKLPVFDENNAEVSGSAFIKKIAPHSSTGDSRSVSKGFPVTLKRTK